MSQLPETLSPDDIRRQNAELLTLLQLFGQQSQNNAIVQQLLEAKNKRLRRVILFTNSIFSGSQNDPSYHTRITTYWKQTVHHEFLKKHASRLKHACTEHWHIQPIETNPKCSNRDETKPTRSLRSRYSRHSSKLLQTSHA